MRDLADLSRSPRTFGLFLIVEQHPQGIRQCLNIHLIHLEPCKAEATPAIGFHSSDVGLEKRQDHYP